MAGWRDAPRIVDPRGYVLRRLHGHHLADCRGYVYEHRLVGEEMLGRALFPGEEIHHGPGGPSDNRPENLTVCASRLAHQEHHRKRDSGLRLHDEPNPTIECACRCGKTFLKFDATGRPRRYVTGHNLHRDNG